jgi:hypothetical protein
MLFTGLRSHLPTLIFIPSFFSFLIAFPFSGWLAIFREVYLKFDWNGDSELSLFWCTSFFSFFQFTHKKIFSSLESFWKFSLFCFSLVPKEKPPTWEVSSIIYSVLIRKNLWKKLKIESFSLLFSYFFLIRVCFAMEREAQWTYCVRWPIESVVSRQKGFSDFY